MCVLFCLRVVLLFLCVSVITSRIFSTLLGSSLYRFPKKVFPVLLEMPDT